MGKVIKKSVIAVILIAILWFIFDAIVQSENRFIFIENINGKRELKQEDIATADGVYSLLLFSEHYLSGKTDRGLLDDAEKSFKMSNAKGGIEICTSLRGYLTFNPNDNLKREAEGNVNKFSKYKVDTWPKYRMYFWVIACCIIIFSYSGYILDYLKKISSEKQVEVNY